MLAHLNRCRLLLPICCCVLFSFSVMLGNMAAGQQRDASSLPPDALGHQSSDLDQVRQELESLRDSYRRRLQELDDQLQYFGFENSERPVYQDVGHSPNLFPDPTTRSKRKSSSDGFFGNGLQVTLGGGGRLKIYGYARGDLIYTNSQLSNTVVPFFAVSEDPSNIVGPNAVPVPNNDDQFNVNVRLTRLGLDFSDMRSPCLYDAELSAKIEIDFETLIDITSESRAVPRIRHAYGEMRWDEVSFLFGQTWDVISPLYPTINDDSLMWNAGNLGDRRPMIRLKWDRDVGEDRPDAAFLGQLVVVRSPRMACRQSPRLAIVKPFQASRNSPSLGRVNFSFTSQIIIPH